MQFICYPKCTTCIKAQKYLDELNIKYNFRDIKLDNPNEDEIKEWYSKFNFDLKKAFNTSGLLYKELKLKENINNLSNEEMIKLLSTNGMLIKRPILITENEIIFGFKEEKYKLLTSK